MSRRWGGRFKGEQDGLFKRFNNSLHFDYRLFEVDVAATIAYAAALKGASVLSAEECATLQDALATLREQVAMEPKILVNALADFEDVHPFVESQLHE